MQFPPGAAQQNYSFTTPGTSGALCNVSQRRDAQLTSLFHSPPSTLGIYSVYFHLWKVFRQKQGRNLVPYLWYAEEEKRCINCNNNNSKKFFKILEVSKSRDSQVLALIVWDIAETLLNGVFWKQVGQNA